MTNGDSVRYIYPPKIYQTLAQFETPTPRTWSEHLTTVLRPEVILSLKRFVSATNNVEHTNTCYMMYVIFLKIFKGVRTYLEILK